MFVTVKAQVHMDSTGATIEIPVLLTPTGVLEPLLDYCLARTHTHSLAWLDKLLRAVTLFLEYGQANADQTDPYLLFRNFALRLYTGTIDTTTGEDPSRLSWRPRSPADVAGVLRHLTDFFTWLTEHHQSAQQPNPVATGTGHDHACIAMAYDYRRNAAMLGHTWSTTSPDEPRAVMARRAPKIELGDPPAFPETHIEDLLFKGFVVGGRLDMRNVLITLLLHGAGFRESEPFHLYIEDVVADPANPACAHVRLHHPVLSYAPSTTWQDEAGRPRKGTRAQYLAERFGLPPRTRMLGNQRAGWKGGMHDDLYFKQAYWFVPEYGELFFEIWRRYLAQVAMVDRPHPFAFVNLHKAPIGGMYCLSKFNTAHAAACRRVGLEPAKALGTTPHGHRHAYGRRLRLANIHPQNIRRFMHHASLESQHVYTQATQSEMRVELEAAAARLHEAMRLRTALGVVKTMKGNPCL